MAGCVYVMVVPEWRKVIGRRKIMVERALVKIGHVDEPENLESRRISLQSEYRTEFRRESWMEVPGFNRELEKANYLVVENQLHEEFASQRVPRIRNRQRGEAREFFDIDVKKAVSALKKTSSRFRGAHEIKRSSAKGNANKRQSQVHKPKSSATVRNRSDIPEGALLTFVRDQRITCTVVIPGKQPVVKYKNERKRRTLTDLTKKLTGYDSVSGPEYWLYRGILVSRLRYA